MTSRSLESDLTNKTAVREEHKDALLVFVSHYKLLSYVCVFMAGKAQTNPESVLWSINCDLFCQSCENKGCIKCPATTEGWSDSSAQQGEGCRQRLFTWRHSKGSLFLFFFVFCSGSDQEYDQHTQFNWAACRAVFSRDAPQLLSGQIIWLLHHMHCILLLSDGSSSRKQGKEQWDAVSCGFTHLDSRDEDLKHSLLMALIFPKVCFCGWTSSACPMDDCWK